MSRYGYWIASLAVLWLSACSTLPRPVGPDDTPRREAAVNKSRIGVTTFWRRGCPDPDQASGWTVEPLFPPGQLDQDLQASLRKADLDRFCVYTYTGTDPNPTFPSEIEARLRSVEPDRVAFAGSAVPSLETMTSDPFYRRFLKQVQVPILPIAGTSQVRLAFLDTQPNTGTDTSTCRPPGSPPPETSVIPLHGYTLINIAEHLTGGNDDSSVQIFSRLALPVERFDHAEKEPEIDETCGGVRGTFKDLADAIVNEIDAWKQQPEASRPPHLVLNLSLGWDGEKLGGWQQEFKDMSPDVQLVYRALQSAADQGVLVIAAAGNERPGVGATENPLLPAGWETLPKEAKPLVYAVSGVDGKGHPLVNTRARGEAPRVAYADHVVVPDLDNPTQPTATLTGTSVATAVVSTTAAAVWSHRPGLEPAEVMRILSKSGDLLPRKPDFYAPTKDPSPEPVRRISLCQALYQACAPTDAKCPTPICAQPPVIPPLDLTAFTPERTTGDLPFVNSLLIPTHPNLLDQPWVLPQPGANPCPNCTVTRNPDGALVLNPQIAAVTDASSFLQTQVSSGSSYKVRIEVPSVWAAGKLQEATLKVTGFDPDTGRKVPMEVCPIETNKANALVTGNTLEATCSGDPGQPFQATLSFTVVIPDTGESLWVESPLFVEY